MKPTFARIRFLLPRNRRLNAEVGTVAMSRPELPVAFELVALDADVITKSGSLLIRSAPLPTPEDAAEVGNRAQLAVLIAATRIRLGVDLGKDGPKSGFFEAGLQMVRQMNGLPEDTAVVNDRLGLTLVDASQKTVFAGLGPMKAIVGSPVARFVDAFAEGYVLAPALTDRCILALELFSASRFEASLRARFLTLVSAVECIAERPFRAADALALVESFRAQLNADNLNEVDQSQLIGAFRDLKRRSIGGSCKALVERHCGVEKANHFGKCYKARSELVHDGRTEFDLGAHTHELEVIVAEAIVKSIPHERPGR